MERVLAMKRREEQFDRGEHDKAVKAAQQAVETRKKKKKHAEFRFPLLKISSAKQEKPEPKKQ